MWVTKYNRVASMALLAFALCSPGAAQAQMETRVIVPESPGGANFAGCYRADRDLFGANRLTMCFEGRGTYTIRGDNRCDGRLSWRVSGRDIFVDLRRASCRGGVAWERASVTCRGTNSLIGSIIRELLPGTDISRLPRLRALNCTYHPTVRGHRDTTFRANRT